LLSLYQENEMGQQVEWRFCLNCHAMFYNGFLGKGVCSAHGLLDHRGHIAQGFNFDLSYDTPETPIAQASWRYCGKCGVLFFYDGLKRGVCAGGSAHDPQGYNFTLPHDVAEDANAQARWRYCQYCQAMFYDGYEQKGPCPGNSRFDLKRGAIHGPHQASGFNFVLPHDLSSPDVPSGSGAPKVSLTGTVWVVSLSHEQAEEVEGSLAAIASAIALLSVPTGPLAFLGEAVAGAIGGAAGVIQLVDAIGGDQGVDVQGVANIEGVLVTPHASGFVAKLIEGARLGVTGATIMDFIIGAGSGSSAIASTFGIPVAAEVFSRIASGTPLGWALAATAGAIVNLLLPTPDPNDHGGIHADRTVVGDWERFVLSAQPKDQISLLSWQGLFSAQNGGGADVYANRPQQGPWETWTLINNGDGTVSFRTNNGHFLTATNGGGDGSYCMADRTATGNWERFYMQLLGDGHVTIRTHDKGTFLSVQPGK
jgi:hypothetical protein